MSTADQYRAKAAESGELLRRTDIANSAVSFSKSNVITGIFDGA